MARTFPALLSAVILSVLPRPSGAAETRPKGDVLLLAWSVNGELALVQESVHRYEGGSWSAFRVVGPGVLQKHYVVADDLGEVGKPRVQKISDKDCRAALVELRDLLRAKHFKGVRLEGEACKADRTAVITVEPEQAAAADESEAEPLPTGDGLEKGEWRMRLEPGTLTLFGPGQKKKALRLPRPIAPETAHVRVSPTRRLLLVLQSVDGGDQILAAGFSSRTGEIADFE